MQVERYDVRGTGDGGRGVYEREGYYYDARRVHWKDSADVEEFSVLFEE